jgi:hypothetical protein
MAGFGPSLVKFCGDSVTPADGGTLDGSLQDNRF